MRSSDSVRAAIVLSALAAFPLTAAAEAPIKAKRVTVTKVAALEQPVSSASVSAFSGSSIAVALDKALETSGVDAKSADAVRGVYEERGGAPVWLTDGKAEALLDTLSGAEAHALPAGRYDAAALMTRLKGLNGATDSKADMFEADLTAAFALYARDVSSGLLEPVRIAPEIEVYPKRTNTGALLREAAMATDVETFLADLAPKNDAYTALLTALVEAKSVDPDAWGPEVPSGRTLKLGMRDSRVGPLRERLTALGFEPVYAVGVAAEDPLRIDVALEESIRLFQADRGLEDDGIVGSRTLASLNQSPRGRIAQIAVNLERLRWYNWDLGKRHILVNQAAFEMTLFENNKSILDSRVVVGKSKKHQTPEFSDEMEYVVFNPYWNVPKSIAREEILPSLKNDPSYLSRNNMTAIPWEGYSPPRAPLQSTPTSVSAEPGQVLAQTDPNAAYRPPSTRPQPVSTTANEDAEADATPVQAAPYNPWSRYSASYFPYSIRQNPGDNNALGHVKFLFPNKHSIYLHDTPSRRLFQRERRDFSHGCVRVQKPMELAETLLGWQSNDPTAFMRRMLAYSSEKWITLEQKVPVHLTYRTARLNADGALDFLPDVYGRDALVAAALEAEGVALR